MPREQVEWFVKQSLHDDDNNKIHARQSCTYYSVVNVNQTNYPYSSSFEQEQSWTLSRTIENIHLTIPSVLTVKPTFTSNTNSNHYEIEKIKLEQPISILPPLPPSRQHALSSHRLNRTNMHQQQTVTNNNFNLKTNLTGKKSRKITSPMRIIQINGEYLVRI
jgi:hypothetical protein